MPKNSPSTYKIVLSIFIILLLSLLVVQQYEIRKHYNKEDRIDLLLKKVDSLIHKKDSLELIIDSTKVKIVEVSKHYEETRNNIIVQPVDSDVVMFSNYISEYYRRLNDLNKSYAIKDSQLNAH